MEEGDEEMMHYSGNHATNLACGIAVQKASLDGHTWTSSVEGFRAAPERCPTCVDRTTGLCVHDAQGVEPACEDCLDDRLAWTSAAGHHAEAERGEAFLREEAGRLFAAGKDEMAGVVRRLANLFKERAKETGTALAAAREKSESNR
jgi:hypothetical protein